ncbi:MAG: ketoacyl-ACP synthase III [Rhodothermaceae bacterium]|nr:ketoacyl-ACP synthase III [Bacteroidota bacterium]MYF63751.1 ketoacyl-ACP synthase III [Rhodothermaceae bacterium]
MSHVTRASITAVGHYVPETRLTNHDLSQMVDTNDLWIRSRTGIEERRILTGKGKGTSYMAARAGREVLLKRGIAPEELDAIIVATVTPDMSFPATACLVQAELGATGAWGFDLSAACSGFLFALNTGAGLIESGRAAKVLVIGSDKMSSITDYTDRKTCVLFGDAAAGVLLEADNEGYGLIDSELNVDGRGWETLCMLGGGSLNPTTHDTVDRKMHYLHQDGQAVFKVAVKGMADVAVEIMKRNNLTGDDVRYLVPHQANQRIIGAVARRMGLGLDRVMLNISKYGNTTAATIPLCLHEWEHELRKGDRIVIAAFGGGFTWGATYLRWAYNAAPVPTNGVENSETAELDV